MPQNTELKPLFNEKGERLSPVLPENVKNFLIDIDGTICDDVPNEEPERMSHVEPYPDALAMLNKWYDEGHVIGRRLFMPTDSSMNVTSTSPDNWVIASTGDQDFVPSFYERYSFNGSLTYRFSSSVRAEYNLFWQNGTGRDLAG